jgi:hypothetical protein
LIQIKWLAWIDVYGALCCRGENPMTDVAKGKSTGLAKAGTLGKYGVPLLGYSLLFGVVIFIVLALQS